MNQSSVGVVHCAIQWVRRNVFSFVREMRLSYLPPLMVYMAYGISGLTAIVGTFFVKEYLGLSAEFLAVLGFWAGIPWFLKMPVGHLVDLIWKWKGILVFLGAGLMAASIGIMIGLLGYTEFMKSIAPVEVWYVISALLSPVGYVLQDVVADAMTVEAVPRHAENGTLIDEHTKRLMHTTMQTLGRVAIVGGGILVSVVNILMFQDVSIMSETEKIETYLSLYFYALSIPIVSVLGVLFASLIRQKQLRGFLSRGISVSRAQSMLVVHAERTEPNWWILFGSAAFVFVAVGFKVVDVPFSEELIFIVSLSIILFLMKKLVSELDVLARRTLVGTAIIIFFFRAIPGPGEGSNWWMIDVLKFDQQFFSVLGLIGSFLALLGMFIFRRFMAEKSIAHIVGFLTIAAVFLGMPIIGMYYGLHEWTASLTGGVVDARFIAIVNTAFESPLGQIAMIPMLAWIANSAPANLKATFFAVLASFSNLALSLSQLGTKYLNSVYFIAREVKDKTTGAIKVPEDYSELGLLLITVTTLGLIVPFAAIYVVKKLKLQSA